MNNVSSVIIRHRILAETPGSIVKVVSALQNCPAGPIRTRIVESAGTEQRRYRPYREPLKATALLTGRTEVASLEGRSPGNRGDGSIASRSYSFCAKSITNSLYGEFCLYFHVKYSYAQAQEYGPVHGETA